jgi:hypothetical protein
MPKNLSEASRLLEETGKYIQIADERIEKILQSDVSNTEVFASQVDSLKKLKGRLEDDMFLIEEIAKEFKEQ